MTLETLQEYCSSLPGAVAEFPFDAKTLVYKIGGKMFILIRQENHPLSINLKCDPDLAISLRESFPIEVFPGYHMNKTHWNTILLEGSLTDEQIFWMVDHSRELVCRSKKKGHPPTAFDPI